MGGGSLYPAVRAPQASSREWRQRRPDADLLSGAPVRMGECGAGARGAAIRLDEIESEMVGPVRCSAHAKHAGAPEFFARCAGRDVCGCSAGNNRVICNQAHWESPRRRSEAKPATDNMESYLA